MQHAVHGAILAKEVGVPELAFPVYGHHSGLPRRDELQNAFSDPSIAEAYERVKVAAANNGWGLQRGVGGIRAGEERLRAEMLLRMVFSTLVDADYLDTEAHFDPVRAQLREREVAEPAALLEQLEADQARLMSPAPATTVNDVRLEVYEHGLEAAELPPGVFRLSVPTGGGKTRSGLAFGLKHAVKHQQRRVIVAVPFTSITDQTAATYRSIFAPGVVLEHHSAVQNTEATGAVLAVPMLAVLRVLFDFLRPRLYVRR